MLLVVGVVMRIHVHNGWPNSVISLDSGGSGGKGGGGGGWGVVSPLSNPQRII